MYQAMLRETRAGTTNALLVEAARLEESNPYAQHDVIYLTPHFDTKDVGRSSSSFHQPRVALSSAQSWLLADAARGCRPSRGGQGEGREVPHPPAGPQGKGTRGVHCFAVVHLQGLRPAAVDSPERQRRRPGQGRGVRQADQDLSAVESRQPARNHLRGCCRLSCTTRPSRMTSASSNHWIAWSSTSHGWSATGS